ncbi:unnamed protein product [Kluyveromyces dobzhanskii CBS 2104]|uniref:Deoxycytidylate deaminase n=1 Tax=Kluyveromyces dobzhanskii CBS 2104 TaxID=1427455 RepID=A0A0A8L3K7_9SACH|nr:unnamed protein product [Kluyveromyces dobzhanskii CBS 2104]
MLIGISGTLFSDVEIVGQALSEIYDATLLHVESLGGWDGLLDYGTKNFMKNHVVHGIDSVEILEMLGKRPFFVHIAVDCTLRRRLENWRNALNGGTNGAVKVGEGGFSNGEKHEPLDFHSIEHILNSMDFHNYSKEDSLISVNERSLIKVVIHSSLPFDTVKQQLQEQLQNVIDSKSCTAPLRPCWDTYFMKLANLAASRANCMKRRVGCVIVRDCRVVATGYNGTPRNTQNCNLGGCARCNEGDDKSLHTCLCLHAEENALLEAGRDRIGPNAILYCDTCPCLTCSVKIVQTGIKEVVYSHSYRMDEQSLRILRDGKVIVRQHKLIDERTTMHIGKTDRP